MNDLAREIWQAWIDGKTVQYWEEGPYVWIDLDPADVSKSIRPESEPHKWRVKPEFSTEKVKVAFYHTSRGGKKISIEREYWWDLVEADENFIGWITEPIEVQQEGD